MDPFPPLFSYALPLPPSANSTSSEFGDTLLSFKAGKLHWDGSRVTADKRRGKLELVRGLHDGLKHCYWIDRDNDNKREDDLIIIGDAYIEKIANCKSGRSFVIRFTSSSRKFLIWMQEPDAKVDELNVHKFNTLAGGKPPSNDESSASTGGATNANTDDDSTSGNGGSGGSTNSSASSSTSSSSTSSSSATSASSSISSSTESSTSLSTTSSTSTSSTSSSSTSSTSALADMMMSHLSNISSSSASALSRASTKLIPLSAILTPDNMMKLVEDPVASAELASLLPPKYNEKEHIINTIRSAQLLNSLNSLTQVIYSDELYALIATMGLDNNDSNNTTFRDMYGRDPMEIFINAVQPIKSNDVAPPPSKKTKKEDGDSL